MSELHTGEHGTVKRFLNLLEFANELDLNLSAPDNINGFIITQKDKTEILFTTARLDDIKIFLSAIHTIRITEEKEHG